jgi:hypothetical protein
MTTKAKSTRFTLIQVADDATDDPGDFGDIAEVKSFDGPSSKAPTIDVSSFDSEAVEKILALADPGEVQLGLNFIGSDGGQQLLNELHYSGESRLFKITFNDHDSTPTTVTFRASVMSFQPAGQTNQAYDLKVSLTVSGKPAWEFAPD